MISESVESEIVMDCCAMNWETIVPFPQPSLDCFATIVGKEVALGSKPSFKEITHVLLFWIVQTNGFCDSP